MPDDVSADIVASARQFRLLMGEAASFERQVAVAIMLAARQFSRPALTSIPMEMS